MKPIRRTICALALLAGGAAAAWRLDWRLAPERTAPEIAVTLALGEAVDPDQIARAWLVPVETAIRAAGGAVSIRGEVRTGAAELRVRLRAGEDAARKAARITSELRPLRARLDGALDVRPVAAATTAETALITSGGTAGEAFALARAIERLPGVRRAEAIAVEPPSLGLRFDLESERAGFAAALAEAGATRNLGDTVADGRRRPVLAESVSPLRDARTALGHAPRMRVEVLDPEPDQVFHLDGKRQPAIRVTRHDRAAPLALDRHLRTLIAGRHDTRIVVSEAEPISRLLRHVLGAVVAWLAVLALFGYRQQRGAGAVTWTAALLLALAGAALALGALGSTIDAATAPALLFGVVAGTSFTLLRSTTRIAAGPLALYFAIPLATLPVAVSLLGPPLETELAEPARALLTAALAAGAAGWLLPRTRPSRPRPRMLKAWMREPATVALAAVTAIAIGLTFFGDELIPTRGRLAPESETLLARVELAPGTPLADTEALVTDIEALIQRATDVESTHSQIGHSWAEIEIVPKASERDEMGRRILRSRLSYRLRRRSNSVRLPPVSRLTGERLELASERVLPEADDEGGSYLAVLRGVSASELVALADRIRGAADLPGVDTSAIAAAVGLAGIRLELWPQAGATPADVDQAAAQIARRAPPASAAAVVLLGPDAARSERVPTRAERLAARGSRAPDSVFTVVEQPIPPAMKRDAGRFYLPIEVHLTSSSADANLQQRQVVDRRLARLELPSGVELERPNLELRGWRRAERRRPMLLAAILPLLLLTVAVILLGSISSGALALLPGLVAVATSAGFLAASRVPFDAYALLALGGCAAFGTSLGITVLARGGGATPIRPLARTAFELDLPLRVAGALFAALAVVTFFGRAGRDPWLLPLRVVAGGGATVTLVALGILPAVGLGHALLRRFDLAEQRRRKHPPEWRAEGPPRLETERLVKIYGSGLRALSDVTVTLDPGVIGLLGPNGAGKTTLIRHLAGLFTPTRGQVRYRGVAVSPDNLDDYRRLVGYLPQGFNAYPGSSAREFLELWALEMGIGPARARMDEIERLLALVGLLEHADRKVRDFSGGMRKRVGVARALLGTPPVLIVDEPTTGLDIESRAKLREVLLAIGRERVVILSTHIASDVEATAGRLLVLSGGRLRFDGAPARLIAKARGRVFGAVLADAEIRDVGKRYRVTARVRRLDGIHIRAVAPPDIPLPGPELEPSLEEAYLALMETRRRRATSSFSFLEDLKASVERAKQSAANAP